MAKNIPSIQIKLQKIRKMKPLYFLGVSLLLILLLIAFGLIRIPWKYSAHLHATIQQPYFQDLARNLYQTRASLIKSLNIAHIPYWFKETSLPVFRILIDQSDIREMNEFLPKDIYAGLLASENKVFVPAIFTSDEYSSEIEVRYRGLGNVHWLNAKRSLLIKFPKENLFQGIKSFDLIVPRDRLYLAEIMQNEHIRRSGLVSRNMFFVRVLINNRDAGVYIAKERFSKQWLEKNGIPGDSEVFSQSSDPSDDTPTVTTELLDLYKFWKRDIHEDIESFDELKTLFYIINTPNDEIFEKNIGSIIDLEKWYKAIAINVFSGKPHSMLGNLNLLFNSATGRFEPLLEDVHIYNIGLIEYPYPEKIYEDFDLITKRILSNQKFYSEYLEVLKQTHSTKELELDLEFYDNLYSRLEGEFYKDQTKYETDIDVTSRVREVRTIIEGNHKNAQYLTAIPKLDIPRPKQIGKSSELTLPESFKNFFDITLTPNRFVSLHPEFKTQNGKIILPVGTYTFRKNIIIPASTELIIEAGTKIYLSGGVSIVSYSPIIARGAKENPIFIGRERTDKNWGALAIINTPEKSEFRYITMVGGSSSDVINGVTFTGMLSAHNAPLYVFDSQFYRDGDDDVINAKYSTGKIARSQFFESTGDAIDLDMTNNFLIENNLFSNIGVAGEDGDAIDISFSDAHILGNVITKCGDKGISVGEKSNPIIESNKISGCAIGIAVKDQSRALIIDNEISKNNEGISLYQKKQIFGGGEATLDNNIFIDNNVDIKKDELSKVIYKDTK